jgi:two-component system, NtrC family, sensor histidine kinase HydH
MERAATDSRELSDGTRVALLLLGVLGPLSGLLAGYGMARGLSRSITSLHVRLQDADTHLDQDVGAVRLESGANLADLDRQVDRVVGRVREVTEQLRRQQKEMVRAEQLAAVGQLAAGVAHEVRNPLTAIKLLVGAALQGQGGPALSRGDLRVIHGEVERLEGTAQALLDFARPPAPRREPCDLRDVIGHALDLVRGRAARQQVTLEAEGGDGALPAIADRGLLSNVFLNLFLNALDAMPHGGRLEVAAGTAAGGEIRVEVRDTGPGIDPAVAGRLFAPFVSSKPTGTGLGLSISRRIVQEHGGRIDGRNLPGGGAAFTVVLPAAAHEGCHANAAGR